MPDAGKSVETSEMTMRRAKDDGEAVRNQINLIDETTSKRFYVDAATPCEANGTMIITRDVIDPARAIHLRDLSDREVVLEGDASCAKAFVERCARTRLVIKGRVVSESVEVWGCEGVEIICESAIATTQVDDATEVTVRHPARRALGAVVFATSRDVGVAFDDEGGVVQRLDDHGLAPGDHREIPQFISRIVNGEIMTERLIRGKDEYPTTERELRASLGASLANEHLDTAPARAELRKDRGNVAFKEGNVAQAAVHYTEALDLDPSHVVALCNRAQCFLKLGEHEKALADAERAIEVKSDYVKAHFRRGLALHALERFTDAVHAFERALALDPKNVQAKDALRVAEYAVVRSRRETRT